MTTPFRIANGGNSGPQNWGTGVGPSYTWAGQGIQVNNATGYDLAVGNQTKAETNSAYNYIQNVSGVTVYKFGFIDYYGNGRNDQIAYGQYFWNGVPGEPAPVPAAAPSGYTDRGVFSTYGPLVSYSGGYAPRSSVNGQLSLTYDVYYQSQNSYSGLDQTNAIWWTLYQDIGGYFNIYYPGAGFNYYWISIRVCTKT